MKSEEKKKWDKEYEEVLKSFGMCRCGNRREGQTTRCRECKERDKKHWRIRFRLKYSKNRDLFQKYPQLLSIGRRLGTLTRENLIKVAEGTYVPKKERVKAGVCAKCCEKRNKYTELCDSCQAKRRAYYRARHRKLKK